MRLFQLIVAGGFCLALSGCYYAQAARGQLEVLRKREPIADVIGDPETPYELAERLRLVQAAREFSVSELGLPDNKSYQTFSDLERDYVVWNVFAAPEFSLVPKQWCYPVAGCVSYRGYFRKEAAEREAQRLLDDDYDVHMGGVAAYSTLGKFHDPVLNTMMRWDDVQLVSVLFHELAHQLLYVKGDTAFNESFATAVEEFGIGRFLKSRDQSADFAAYVANKAVRRELMQSVAGARGDLKRLYAQDIGADEMRDRKQQRIDKLQDEIRELLLAAGRSADNWLVKPLNNARIASLSLYEGRVPEFRVMLAACADDLPCFYAESQRIAKLDKTDRDAYLDAL